MSPMTHLVPLISDEPVAPVTHAIPEHCFGESMRMTQRSSSVIYLRLDSKSESGKRPTSEMHASSRSAVCEEQISVKIPVDACLGDRMGKEFPTTAEKITWASHGLNTVLPFIKSSRNSSEVRLLLHHILC